MKSGVPICASPFHGKSLTSDRMKSALLLDSFWTEGRLRWRGSHGNGPRAVRARGAAAVGEHAPEQ